MATETTVAVNREQLGRIDDLRVHEDEPNYKVIGRALDALESEQ